MFSKVLRKVTSTQEIKDKCLEIKGGSSSPSLNVQQGQGCGACKGIARKGEGKSKTVQGRGIGLTSSSLSCAFLPRAKARGS